MDTFPRARLRKVLGIRRSSFLYAFYIFFYATYLITGGFMFAAFEAPVERAIRLNVAQKRDIFLLKHTCVSSTLIYFFYYLNNYNIKYLFQFCPLN